MSKFKVGDLALVVGSVHMDSPNLGKSVEVHGVVAPGETFALPDGRIGRHAGLAKDAYICVAADLLCHRVNPAGWIDTGGAALFFAEHLMPLRGDFQPEQQKAKEVEA
ncbi:hypothetical protein [Pseudomonas nicosulfuronedens]